MIKKIILTEDHIKLIKNINFEMFNVGETYSTDFIDFALNEIETSSDGFKRWGLLRDELIRLKDNLKTTAEKKECHAWGIDQWSLFGGTYVFEDIALILGKYDEYIKGTEEDPLGKQYPKELEDYWWGLYDYIWRNMKYIIKLVFYYCDKGGITPGEYHYDSNTTEWTKVGN